MLLLRSAAWREREGEKERRREGEKERRREGEKREEERGNRKKNIRMLCVSSKM